MHDALLTDELKAMALALGADLVGVAPASRYAEAPPEMSPQGHLPGATSVFVVAIHHPDAAIERSGNEHPQQYGAYGIQGTMNTKLECISFQIARRIEQMGFDVIAIPATNVWRFRPYKAVKESFAPDLSNIHAAAAAGMGEIGYSGLLLTPEFGPRQRFCCLVTDAPLVPDPLYEGPPLCDNCGECVRHCPTDAFTKETSGRHVINIGGKTFSYCNKSKWRCSWAEHFGLDLDLDIPDIVDEQVILECLAREGRRGGEMGSCLRYCLPPHLRLDDPDYSTTYRRRRPHMDERPMAERAADAPISIDHRATLSVITGLLDREADAIAIVDRHTAAEHGFDITRELPDAQTLIAFAHQYPKTMQDPASSAESPAPQAPVGATLREWSNFAELELCQYLEAVGHSAMPGLHLPASVYAPASGLAIGKTPSGAPVMEEFGARVLFGCVLTSAPLQPVKRVYPFIPVDPPPAEDDLRDLISTHASSWGADLFGVADPTIIAELAHNYRALIDENDMKWSVVDRGNYHGPVEPEIVSDPGRHVRTAEELLPGARSVIVVGYHYPFSNLLRAAEPPTDAVGPYSYAVYQANRWLRYLGVSIARQLQRTGYRAVVTQDLSATGSLVANPRGPQPDALCNRFAAVAAGLGQIGLHGAVITPEYGLTQRFIAVVTDAALPTDAPILSDGPCVGCSRPCIASCPVAALGEQVLEIASDGFVTRFADWDRLRCDWAKRYGLVGAEGPQWGGQETNILPPESGKLQPEMLADAYAQKDPIQKHFTMVLEPCLQACQRKLTFG